MRYKGKREGGTVRRCLLTSFFSSPLYHRPGRFTGKKNQDVFDEEEIIKLLGMEWMELGDFQNKFLHYLETMEVSRAEVVNTFDG